METKHNAMQSSEALGQKGGGGKTAPESETARKTAVEPQAIPAGEAEPNVGGGGDVTPNARLDAKGEVGAEGDAARQATLAPSGMAEVEPNCQHGGKREGIRKAASSAKDTASPEAVGDGQGEIEADAKAAVHDETESDAKTESVAAPDSAPEADSLAALRAEAALLRAELAAERRLSAELREFCSLYPETPTQAIPDEVWSRVKEGIPLAAAYALHERRLLCERKAADAAHADAKTRSSGALEGPTGVMPYTPAEVRAMSANEVRQNYTAILASMKRW